MIAAELRGGNKPSLNEALGWIGSRVDDIYGANVGRLEDVWIDPGTGAPRWLLVKEGRFGGRTTLIPFEDATAGAGHVWVPYEREIVGAAPEIEPGAPLTHQVEASLRSHYAASTRQGTTPRERGAAPQASQPDSVSGFGTATVRLHGAPEAEPPPAFGVGGQPAPPPIRERRPTSCPPARRRRSPRRRRGMRSPPGGAPRPRAGAASPQPPPAQPYPPQPAQPYAYPTQPQAPGWAPQPDWSRQEPPPPEPDPIQSLRSLADSPEVHYVEIELTGELSIRGELRSVRIVPRR